MTRISDGDVGRRQLVLHVDAVAGCRAARGAKVPARVKVTGALFLPQQRCYGS
jgi:hypothetical protein